LVWLLPALLVVAVVVNGEELSRIVRGEKSWKSVIYGRVEDPNAVPPGWKMPANSGPQTAKVKVEVFLHAGDPCHLDSALVGVALGALEPQRLRVEFLGSASAEGAKRFEKMKLGCEQGLAINGKTKFKLVDTADPSKKVRTIYTTHEGLGAVPNALYRLLDGELKTQYKGQGLKLSASEFDAFLQAKMGETRVAIKAATEAEIEAAKASLKK
jgi:hypothetical protein